MCMRRWRPKLDLRNFPEGFFHLILEGRPSQSNSELAGSSGLAGQPAHGRPVSTF